MPQLTTKQYQTAIENNVLSKSQIDTLEILYSQPNHSAQAIRLAELIHPINPANVIASGRIGKIGKAFSDYHNILPTEYYEKDKSQKLGYFTLVSDTYDPIDGWTMYPNLRKALQNLGIVKRSKAEVPIRLSTEVLAFEEEIFFKEGKLVRVFVDRFERNRKARNECIKHHGDSCIVCGFNFERTYGKDFKGYIHIHHLSALSTIKKTYLVDPKKDLVPICPNCHAAIHNTNPAMSINTLKKLLNKGR